MNTQTGGDIICCYNYKKRGHLVNSYQEPRTRGGEYFKQTMLLAYKAEAGGNIN